MIKPTALERPKVAAEPSFSMKQVNYGLTNQDMQNMEYYTQSIAIYKENDVSLTGSDDYDSMQYTFDHDGSYYKQWFST